MSQALSINQWLARLEQLNPLHIELGLERVRAVWQYLPPLSAKTRVIIVGGTNGKGSTVLLLEQLLIQQGLTVGSYLSPHLVRFNERIRWQRQEIGDLALCDYFEKVEQARGDVPLTYFEFTTLAALSYFSQQAPDVVILEVGLGGRLDAVNILDADIAVLTNVDLDHQDWLGSDREAIGREKAGIFRPGAWALYADADMPQSVRREAERLDARLLQLGKDFRLEVDEGGDGLRFSLASVDYRLPRMRAALGSTAAAMAAAQLVLGEIQPEALASLPQTALPGRYQRIRVAARDIILDCAHNPAAARLLALRLREEGDHDLHLILGMMADKDIEAFVRELSPLVTRWTLVQPHTTRAMPAERLASLVARNSSADLEVVPDIGKLDWHNFPTDGPTLVTGSFYTVGEFVSRYCGGSCA